MDVNKSYPFQLSTDIYKMFEQKINNNILLRLISHNDAEDLFTTVEKNREFLREWLPWVDETKTVEDTKSFIKTSLKQYANNEGPVCVITLDNEIIGVISFQNINTKNKSGGIGYWLSKNHNGKGIMTQCCKVMVEYGFNELGLNRITIPAAKINKKSRAIPERLGFTEEGTLREAEWLNDHGGACWSTIAPENGI